MCNVWLPLILYKLQQPEREGKGVEDLLLLMSEVDLSRQVDLCFIRQEPFAGHQLHTKPDDDSGGRHLTIEHRVLEFFTGENSY